jgi:excinuclease ABC subunit B
MGRAARNVNGRAILYADVITASMQRAIGETERRRAIQHAYNEANGITPQTIVKPIDMSLVAVAEADYVTVPLGDEEDDTLSLSPEQRDALISELEAKMRNAAKAFEFEKAAQFRDRVKALKANEVYEDASTSRSDSRG